jgi:hypothetical protein
VDALCRAGCGDATFGVENGSGYGDFHREALFISNAVIAATSPSPRHLPQGDLGHGPGRVRKCPASVECA